MTTVQESTDGHLPQKGYPPAAKVYQQDELSSLNEGALFAGNKVLPPPGSFPDSQEENRSKDSTNSSNSIPVSPIPTAQPFPATAYHVPPSRYARRADSYRHDDTPNLPPETEPLPERCQFMFSDGRQCTMARSDIHPSLCHYHSEREEQLFGAPGLGGGAVVGRSFDLPELYLASADLTTAAGVSRALAQVFRLLAQRRISRQEAATFGHLAQLLLRSISLMRSENIATHRDAAEPVILSEERRISQNGSHSVSIRSSAENDDATSIVIPSEYHERGASPALLPHEKAARSSDAHPNTKQTPKPGPSFRATIWSEESLSAPPTSEESVTHITRPSLDTLSAVSHALSEPTADKNSSGIDTSATSVCNSPEINTYKIAELKVPHNEHLHKNGCGANEHPRDGRASQRRE